MRELPIELCGETMIATARGGLVWPREEILLVADLHLGKTASFRAKGLPLPEGSTTETLQWLEQDMLAAGVPRAVVLGDLWHDAVGVAPLTSEILRDWLQRTGFQLELVPGNHDRRCLEKLDELGIRRLDSAVSWGPFSLRHQVGDDTRFQIAGHLHPVLRIGGRRVKAFLFRKDALILPAYGAFTGGCLVDLAVGEKALLATGTRIFELNETRIQAW